VEKHADWQGSEEEKEHWLTMMVMADMIRCIVFHNVLPFLQVSSTKQTAEKYMEMVE